MGWAARVGWTLVSLGVGGCGGTGAGPVRAAPAPVVLADRCTVDGVQVEVEEGVEGGFTGEGPCSYSGRFVSVWRGIYEARWGAVGLETWTVRIRAPERVDGREHGGLTWYRQRLIELSQLHFELLPHELHHAAEGEASTDHHGWCDAFVPWELERHIQDERAQLGCGF